MGMHRSEFRCYTECNRPIGSRVRTGAQGVGIDLQVVETKCSA